MSIDDPELPISDEPPVDLTPLRLGAGRFDALAARIEAAATHELARRAEREGLQRTLARAAWPALIAAAAALFAVVGLGRSSGASTDSSLAASGIERIVAASAVNASWIMEQSAPSDDDLAQAIGLGSTQ